MKVKTVVLVVVRDKSKVESEFVEGNEHPGLLLGLTNKKVITTKKEE